MKQFISRKSSRASAYAVVLIWLWCSGSFAMGQESTFPQVSTELTLEQIITQLGDTSYVRREEATKKLGAIAEQDFTALYSFLDAPNLTPEQRYRVLQVYSDILVNRPLGALGISMNQRNQRNMPNRLNQRNLGVEISSVTPGFPAEKVLKPGDRIRKIDGVLIRGGDDLKRYVQTKKPGDRIRIMLDRPEVDEAGLPIFNPDDAIRYKTIEVELELGSVEKLERVNPNGPPIALASLRRERMKIARDTKTQFAPRPRIINISNKKDIRAVELFGDSQESSAEDNHPAIVELLGDIQRLIDQDKNASVEDRNRWDNQLRELLRESRRSDITQDYQKYMNKVSIRYIQLRPRR